MKRGCIINEVIHPLFSMNIILSSLFRVLWIKDGRADFGNGQFCQGDPIAS
jgi:hypothetical protein